MVKVYDVKCVKPCYTLKIENSQQLARVHNVYYTCIYANMCPPEQCIAMEKTIFCYPINILNSFGKVSFFDQAL